MDKDNIDVIDSFFADHPGSVKPIRTKSSQLHNNNHDRSTALSRKRRIDNDEATQPRSRSRKADPALDHSNIIKSEFRAKRVELIPRNIAQEEYADILMDRRTRISVAVGPAGCGKTYMAVQRAIIALRNNEVENIVITRPAVSVDEEHGFLPGTITEKMAPWLRPVIDVFEEYYGKEKTAQMILEGIIEFSPLAYMRGRSFKNVFILVEEAQNCTQNQALMITTRIGSGCTMAITGDLKQHDRGFEKNGLGDLIARLESSPAKSTAIRIARFDRSHVERDPIVSEILELYGED